MPPVVGVGAVVFVPDGRVVLIKRRYPPLAGEWSIPGGKLELGETLEAGTAREALEETGLVVGVGPLIEVFDRILMDETGQVGYHFVLVDFLCRPVSGTLSAGSDAEAVTLADPAALAPFALTPKAQSVIARAVRMREEQDA
jgi:8-oxo-dGTP diphosphatase